MLTGKPGATGMFYLSVKVTSHGNHESHVKQTTVRSVALSAKTSTRSNTLQSLVNPLRVTLILKWGGGTHTLQSILEMTYYYELGVFRTYGEKKYQSQQLVYSNRKSKSICCDSPIAAKNHMGICMGGQQQEGEWTCYT